MIANHVAARLSDLDLRIARAVPPGGNWKDVPEDVPSERLAQIRRSYAEGKGSRSTYYGRLRADRPSYTVSTYYNRPGNGCFLHYDFVGGQHRTISHREAARFQSFPDDFRFVGTQRAVCQQIGNAVPPLLAFQVARAIGTAGFMADVFAGAGGLSLGFKWAGWNAIGAVDNDKSAVATFNQNFGDLARAGDMRADEVRDGILARAAEVGGGHRLALVGGPPCQGFSTGGKRRSAEDERNSLYLAYVQLLRRLAPNIFVFENVTGLLNMEGGSFLSSIRNEFHAAGYLTTLWRLNAACFGVPQRRERVFIVGVPAGTELPRAPQEWTSPSQDLALLPAAPSADHAIGDLPAISAGEDGSDLPYRKSANSFYCRFMRGELTAFEYVAGGGTHDSVEQLSLIRGIAEAAE